MSSRLPTHIEVAGILRRVEQAGGFATVLRRGDRDRGTILLLIGSRGRHYACLERLLDLAGNYEWRPAGPPESADSSEVSEFLAKRARFDEDFWALELDVADPERFTAETVAEA